jgi:hypothetical protein
VSKGAVTPTSIADTLVFPFRAEHASNRLLVGVGLLFLSIFVPIVPALAVYGYLLQIMHDVIQGQPAHLPEWKDWGKLILDGLKAFLVGLVYLLPAALVFSVGFGFYCGSTLVMLALSNGSTSSAAGDNAMAGVILVSMVVFFLSFSIGTVLSLLGALPLPTAVASLSEKDSLGSALALGRVYRLIKANPGGYIVAWLLLAGMWAFMYWGLAVAYYTLIFACLIPFFVMPIAYYTLLVAAALFGQAYRESVASLAKAERS